MQPKSLAFRLVASSAVVACVMLLAAALLLNGLFQRALERNFDERLRAVMDGLLASVELSDDGALNLPSPLADPRFTIPLSGWYWQVTPVVANAATKDLASVSLLEKRLVVPGGTEKERAGNGFITFTLTDGNNQQLRVMEQRFELFDTGRDYSFVVSGNFDELKAEVQSFRNLLYTVLSLLGLGLLLATLVQVKFGLKPMQELQQKLNDIRSGKVEFLDGPFPREMQPVADEMNLVIRTGFDILERARTQVGNLAHALKTPLSVLSNEAAANPSPLASKVLEQTNVMQESINLYLDRARRAARAQNLGLSADVEPVLESLARTLRHLNRDKAVTIAVTVEPRLKFRGDQQDLEEMVGNLLDNACKWAAGKVRVAARTATFEASGRQQMQIIVEDDGPGIPPAKRDIAVRRGQRLDERMPGSGLGLNIVSETAALYEGKLELSDSELGGLSANLWLPTVPK